MRFICPLIVVDDIARSRRFYEEVLNQEVEFDFGENVTFRNAFAIHLKDHFITLMGSGSDIKVAHKSNDSELYFETDDVIEDHRRLKQANVEFIHDLAEQPWGQRVMRFYDPDWHIVEVGENMQSVVLRYHEQGYTIDDICRKTSMPREFVEMLVKCK